MLRCGPHRPTLTSVWAFLASRSGTRRGRPRDYARTLKQAKADAAWLADHWPHLIEMRIPGTARPWRQTDLDPVRRAELDARDRAERLERADIAPGETLAPVHVDVLDVLGDITAEADDLAERAFFAAGTLGPWRAAQSAYAGRWAASDSGSSSRYGRQPGR